MAVPVHLTSISPFQGEGMVNTTRETIIRFDDRVDPATVNADSFYLIANGERVPGTIRVSPNETFATFFYQSALQPATEVRVVVDGSRVRGRDGLLLDADNDTEPGGTATADFTTLPLTRIPGTHVWGYVYDSYNKNPAGSNIPVVGATIRVDALPGVFAVTDQNGYFILRNMPAPEFFVHVDGTTATNAPTGTMYPSVGKPFHSVPGQSTQLFMDGKPFDVYLPPMASGDVQTLSTVQPTDVGFGPAAKAELTQMLPNVDPSVFDLVKVAYPANGARGRSRQPGQPGHHHPRTPGPDPGASTSGLEPSLVISVQAPGATNFTTPAPITFPNLDGLPAGSKASFLSFNHDAGRWDFIGLGTVSADGTLITSDPGVGIRAPGWHITGPPPQGPPRPTPAPTAVRSEPGKN